MTATKFPTERAPSGKELLGHRIESASALLSRKQRGLARYILANTGVIAFATAAEVGEATGVSAATAVRFAQTIGYQGFTELRDSLRDGLRSFPPVSQQLEELVLHHPATPDEHIKFVFSQAYQALAETVHSLDSEVLLAAARSLASAERIALVGSGTSNSVLELLFFHLTRIGLPAIRPRDTVESVNLVASLTSRDVAFAATYWRFLRSTSDWLRAAKRNEATTIAITDSAVFPARDYVDHVIIVTSKGVGHGPSVVASIAAVDAIASLLVTLDPERFVPAVERREAAYREGHLLQE